MSLRSHVILAVFKRNFLSYFSSVIGYLFIVAFVGLAAFRAFTPEFFADNQATLDHLNVWFSLLLLFIVPAISMTSWADEKKQGTDELLFTLPAHDVEILLGKYLSVVAIFTTSLLFSFLFGTCAVLGYLTHGKGSWFDFDLGLIIANYFGYWISGSSLLAAGMVASVLTSSPTVAFILGGAFCAIPVVLGKFPADWQVIQALGLDGHLRDFGLGMIPLADVVYFLSLAGLMLYINLALISKRHWSGGPNGVPMGMHYVVRGVCLAIILFGVNVVVASSAIRLDFTAERIYSLAETSRTTIGKINSKRPVTIQAFISRKVPGEYTITRSNLIGLLRQFDQVGGDKVRVRIVETETYSPSATEAKGYGIQPQRLQTQRAGRFQLDQVFMGCVISSGADDEVVLPFFDVGTPVEYELTRAIRTVSQSQRRTVGILATDAKLFGGFDQTTFSSTPEWKIVSDLKKQYKVEQVMPDAPITGNYDVLIAAMPSSLTDPQLQVLVDYIKTGKPTLIFDDPLPMFSNMQLAPRQPKPSAGGGMFGQQAPPTPKADGGKATRLINLLGCVWDNGETVFDSYNPHPEFDALIHPELLWISAKSGGSEPFNRTNPATSGLQEVMIPFAGTIRPQAGSALEFTPLLRASKQSGVVSWDDNVTVSPAFFGQGGPRLKDPEEVPMLLNSKETEFVLAAQIKSKSADKGEQVNVIYVTDVDLISDWFYEVREKMTFDLKLDNVPFAMNCVDLLAGEEELIGLRKRRSRQRTLTAVEVKTERFNTDRRDASKAADEAAKKELDEARERLKEKLKKINDDKSLDPQTQMIMSRTMQQEESTRLLVLEADIQNKKTQQIEEAKSKSEQEIRNIEFVIGLGAVLLPPIPALLLGIFVYLNRVGNENRNIVADRLVRR